MNYPPPQIPADADASAVSEQLWLWVQGLFDQIDGLLEEPDRDPEASAEAVWQLAHIMEFSAFMVARFQSGQTEGLRELVQDRLAAWP